ncbi:MAG: hypothetical protein VKK97_10905 [Synechococcaceae cyanobacterium]|nr:hypothetical protein [Synechococcaceae cyanobacterium]
MAGSLGDVIAYGSGSSLAPWLSSAACLLGIGLFALLTSKPSNDDDDSTPGGGLMQPVA